MNIQSKHHWPRPSLIIGLTFLGAIIYHLYTQGIRDYLKNGFFIFGELDINYLMSGDWWPEYFIYPLIVALIIGYRVRQYQISLSNFKEGTKIYKKIIDLLREEELEIVEQQENACSLLPQWRTFSDRFLHSDYVKIYHLGNRIEIIGRQKFLGNLEFKLIRMAGQKTIPTTY